MILRDTGYSFRFELYGTMAREGLNPKPAPNPATEGRGAMFWLGFIVGFMIGLIGGTLVVSLLVAARRGDG